MSNREELKKLKEEADNLGIEYAKRVTVKTLKKKIEEFKASQEEDVAIQEEDVATTKAVEKRYCKGLFVWLPETEFINNPNYSDRYLKQKNLI
jgi:hypothetical protein